MSAVGPQFHRTGDEYHCTFSSSISGVTREATATMTFDGIALAMTHSQLSDGKTRFAEHCS
jgi:hypothetical protein